MHPLPFLKPIKKEALESQRDDNILAHSGNYGIKNTAIIVNYGNELFIP
jgi:hypothetical protein